MFSYELFLQFAKGRGNLRTYSKRKVFPFLFTYLSVDSKKQATWKALGVSFVPNSLFLRDEGGRRRRFNLFTGPDGWASEDSAVCPGLLTSTRRGYTSIIEVIHPTSEIMTGYSTTLISGSVAIHSRCIRDTVSISLKDYFCN